MRPAEITIRDIPATPTIENHIREKVEKLVQYHDRIHACHVIVELSQKHQIQGKLFNVRINLSVPGKDLVVNRIFDEDLYIAIRDAFNALIRKLESYAQRKRGGIKNHDGALHGTVERLFLDEGYGFIRAPDGHEIYFQKSNVVYPSFEKLELGENVQFLEVAGNDGFQAHRVSAGKHHVEEENYL